jgi:hypothetical protein
MKKDIPNPQVEKVTLAVVREGVPGLPEWKVVLINENDFPIDNTLVSSQGYGEKDGAPERTSVLRHFLETVPAKGHAVIEPIDPALFHLTNEYWVSYYIDTQIYDRKFVFVPDTICEENLIFIKALEMEGVLHS